MEPLYVVPGRRLLDAVTPGVFVDVHRGSGRRGGFAQHVGDLHAHEIDRFCYRESMVRVPRWMTALPLAEWASGAPFECAGKQAVWYPAQWP